VSALEESDNLLATLRVFLLTSLRATNKKQMKPQRCINTGKTSSQQYGDPTLLLFLFSSPFQLSVNQLIRLDMAQYLTAYQP
jgi:hypothetical protein